MEPPDKAPDQQHLETPVHLDVESVSLGLIASQAEPDRPKIALLLKDLKYRTGPDEPEIAIGNGILFLTREEFVSLLGQVLDAGARAGIVKPRKIIIPGEGN